MSHFLPTVTHACESLDIALARDVAARKFSWSVLPSRSMAFVRFDSSYVSEAWMPPKRTSKYTEDRSPKSSVFWHPRGVARLRPTLNQHLQSYFYNVQHITPRTCHPSIIHHEARFIIHSLSPGLAGQPQFPGDTAVAKALFRAGTARLEYTRTVALIIYDVLVELNLSDWFTMRTLQIQLGDMATSTILKAWSNLSVDSMFTPQATGLEKCTDSLQHTRDEMFHAAAFYGDLVAIGVIPCTLLDSVITGFLECLTSVSQCRILYLLLVRATFYLASPIKSDYLLGWRRKLLFPRPIKLPMNDEMVQRWIIELCNVIDKAIDQYQPVNHIWDMKLTGIRELVSACLN